MAAQHWSVPHAWCTCPLGSCWAGPWVSRPGSPAYSHMGRVKQATIKVLTCHLSALFNSSSIQRRWWAAEMATGGEKGVILEDVPSLDLMTELLRRMKCASKPDKRLILIGITSSCLLSSLANICSFFLSILLVPWKQFMRKHLPFVDHWIFISGGSLYWVLLDFIYRVLKCSICYFYHFIMRHPLR